LPEPTKNKMKHLRQYIALVAIVTSLSEFVYAVPQLMIFDGTTSIVISDNGAGDSSGVAGRIVWDGSIGNWSLNTHVGTTYPIIGSLANPMLDLSFNAVSNTAGGTLTLSFSADGFGPTAGIPLSSIGGVAQGTVTYQTYGGANNTLFSTSNLLTSQGPFSGPFSGSLAGAAISNAGPYSLTQRVTITHIGNSISTGNALLQVPESGTSVILLGLGLTCLGFLARFRGRFL
jgi:hypothetical protein